MIIEFKVKNFKSIKEEQTLSFLSTAIKEHPENYQEFPELNLNILKSATMYGANASGKSNLIKSIAFFRNFVTNSFKDSQKGDQINRIPFLLCKECLEEPSVFELSFIMNSKDIVTYGFSVTDDSVIEEHLLIDDEDIFNRDKENFTFHPNFKDKWELRTELINQNSLFLSLLASTNDTVGYEIFSWIKENIIVFSGLRSLKETKTLDLMNDSEKYIAEILNMAQVADLGIEELKVVENKSRDELIKSESISEKLRELLLENESKHQIGTVHSVFSNNGEKTGLLTVNGISQFESDGTKQFLGLAGHIINSIEHGKVLFIDELGAQFHPIMSRYVISLFNNSINNKGQLFFTTHDVTNLDNEVFRRDQIWFAEKNIEHSSIFKSLVEYKFNNSKVRNDERYAKNYLQGKYGAIPFINYNFIDSIFKNQEAENFGEN